MQTKIQGGKKVKIKSVNSKIYEIVILWPNTQRVPEKQEWSRRNIWRGNGWDFYIINKRPKPQTQEIQQTSFNKYTKKKSNLKTIIIKTMEIK